MMETFVTRKIYEFLAIYRNFTIQNFFQQLFVHKAILVRYSFFIKTFLTQTFCAIQWTVISVKNGSWDIYILLGVFYCTLQIRIPKSEIVYYGFQFLLKYLTNTHRVFTNTSNIKGCTMHVCMYVCMYSMYYTNMCLQLRNLKQVNFSIFTNAKSYTYLNGYLMKYISKPTYTYHHHAGNKTF